MKFGAAICGVFFLLVFFAALTSAISLMETVVSIIQDKLHGNGTQPVLSWPWAPLLSAFPLLGFGPGNVQFMGMSILDMFDFLSNSVIMPIVAC
ncbi:MAG: hypothetical protein ACLTXL_13395 [Clostridia bacterium]